MTLISKHGLSLAVLAGLSLAAAHSAQAQTTQDTNVLQGTTVTASNVFAGNATVGTPSNLTDGAAGAFAFADPSTGNPESVSLTGFNSAIGTLRFFDAPAFTGRTSPSVTVGYSTVANAGLNGTYTFVNGGAPLLLATSNNGNDYATLTTGPEVMTGPGSNGSQNILFSDLTGLNIPTGTQSLLLNFTAPPSEVVGGTTFNNGAAFTEIQGFAPAIAAAPEPAQTAALAFFGLGLGVLVFKARKRAANTSPVA